MFSNSGQGGSGQIQPAYPQEKLNTTRDSGLLGLNPLSYLFPAGALAVILPFDFCWYLMQGHYMIVMIDKSSRNNLS